MIKILLIALAGLCACIAAQSAEPRAFGWKPDVGGVVDKAFGPRFRGVQIKESVDLRSSMPPVYDQGMIGSCHDDKTEVLTSAGWKLWSEIIGNESFATVDPQTSELTYEAATRIFRIPYKGKLVCAENNSINFRVTPEHKMLVRKWNEKLRTLEDGFSFVEAGKIGWYCGLMNKVIWRGEGDLGEQTILAGVDHKLKSQRIDTLVKTADWMRFVGIYLAEGTMYKNPTDPNIGYRVQLAGVKERERAFIQDTLRSIGLPGNSSMLDRYHFQNKRIYSALYDLGLLGVKACDKFIPESLFSHSGEMLAELVYGHFMGDGCEQNGLRAHYTSSPALADGLQRAIFLSGKETSMSSRPARSSVMLDGRAVRGRCPEYRVAMRKKDGLSIERKKDIFEEDYDGVVYCAEVPTFHTLVTRRGGKILVSGNCVGNGVSVALDYAHVKSNPGLKFFTPSRLFIYYQGRVAIGTVNQDSGCQIRDAIAATQKLGAPLESLWPYRESKFKLRPPATAYSDALKRQIIQAYKAETLDDVKRALSLDLPVVFGVPVYRAIQDLSWFNYTLPLPAKNERSVGGHCMTVVGYRNSDSMLIVRNSWGTNWGRSGHMLMPFEYWNKFQRQTDAWVISVAE
jgi:hypothetical protein